MSLCTFKLCYLRVLALLCPSYTHAPAARATLDGEYLQLTQANALGVQCCSDASRRQVMNAAELMGVMSPVMHCAANTHAFVDRMLITRHTCTSTHPLPLCLCVRCDGHAMQALRVLSGPYCPYASKLNTYARPHQFLSIPVRMRETKDASHLLGEVSRS